MQGLQPGTKKTKVHVIKSFEEMPDIVANMSAEARAYMKQNQPKMVKYIIGDFHGCGSWRVLYPSVTISTMREDLKIVYDPVFDPGDVSHYRHFDLLVMQRQVAPGFEERMKHLKKVRDDNKLPIVTAFEIDDWLFGIPKYNMAYDLYANRLGKDHLVSIINCFDAMIVSTDYLKKLYTRHYPKEQIHVLKNHIPKWLWDRKVHQTKTELDAFKLYEDKPRILFAGGANRFTVKGDDLDYVDDITQLEEVIRNTVDEFHWIFMGAQPLRLSDLFDAGKIEKLPWQANLSYPGFARDIKADIALSPLLDNAFNRAKSNIKILEYACLGIPSIYADLVPYDELPKEIKVKPGDTQGWEDKIREMVGDQKLRQTAQLAARDILEKSWIENNTDVYHKVYTDIIENTHKQRNLIL